MLKAAQSGLLVSQYQKHVSCTQVLCFCLCPAPGTGTCAHHTSYISKMEPDSDSDTIPRGVRAGQEHSLCYGVLQAQWPCLSRRSRSQWSACKWACNRKTHEPSGKCRIDLQTCSDTQRDLPEHTCVMATPRLTYVQVRNAAAWRQRLVHTVKLSKRQVLRETLGRCITG